MAAAQNGTKDRIILGTMTFGPDADAGARVTSLDEYKKALDVFQKHGYDEIDTARVYVGGKQEGWTADAGYKERGLKIASKWYPKAPGDHEADKLKEVVNTSLKELRTDQVDIYYLHAADRSTPFKETLKAMDDLYKEGKFKTFALSNFTAAEVAEICLTCHYNNWVKPTLYQGMYNAITRGIEPELLVTLRRFGLDIVVYNPIAGGILSGKYKSDEVPKEGRFSDSAVSGKIYRSRYFNDGTWQAIEIIEKAIAKHPGLTMVETALRWCVHHSKLNMRHNGKGNDGIIIGASSVAQLESNLNDLEKGPLPEDVVKALDEAWAVKKATAPNYWHLDNEYKYDTLKAVYGN